MTHSVQGRLKKSDGSGLEHMLKYIDEETESKVSMVDEILKAESNCIIVSDSACIENSHYVIGGVTYKLIKHSDNLIQKGPKLTNHKNDLKSANNVRDGELFKTCLDFIPFHNCTCDNGCGKCRYCCLTCKTPCRNCNLNFSLSKSCWTDTDDFERYLDTLSKKIKALPKTKVVGTDTCDLEAHFDFYKSDKKEVKIMKTVATDCKDLFTEKVIPKPRKKKTIATDTHDLSVSLKDDMSDDDESVMFGATFRESEDEESDVLDNNCESDSKTTKNSATDLVIVTVNPDQFLEQTSPETNTSHELSIKAEKTYTRSTKVNKIPILAGDSSSDESDLDLATAKTLMQCRESAKKFKLSLNKSTRGVNTVYGCYFCFEEFTRKHLALIHLNSHFDGEQFECLECSKKLKTPLMLKKHITMYHDMKQLPLPPVEEKKASLDDSSMQIENRPEPELSILNVGEPKSNLKCNLCDDSDMFTEGSLKVHIEEFHKKGKRCIALKKVRLKNEFLCLSCGKEFKSNRALQDHFPVHTGVKNYQCEICNKSYTTSANLHTHKQTHTGAKNFKCTVCEKAFHKKDSLKVHLRKHSGEKPFPCDLCPMRFDRNYILKNHRLRHLPQKSYICPTCGKAFTTHGGLNNHEKCHNRDPSLKKHRKPAVKATLEAENAVICDECGKVYSTKSNLRMHKFVHLGVKPYICPVCHHCYAKKDSMITHMRTHTDERPFACDICGMTFFRNHTLKTHRLRHTGERPHKCNKCGKSFTQSSSLAYHLKHHDRMVKTKLNSVDEGFKLPKKKRYSSALKQMSLVNKKPLKSPKFENVKTTEPEVEEIKNLNVLKLKEEEAGDKEYPLSKGGHFLLPVKESHLENTKLIKEKDIVLTVEDANELQVYHVDKHQSSIIDTINFMPPNKVNCFVTKQGNILTITKQKRFYKSKKYDESDNNESLIVSKNSYINKDGNLITPNDIPSVSLKHDKEEYITINNTSKNMDELNVLHVTENTPILNSTLISDENVDIIPYSLHNMSVDNLLSTSILPGSGTSFRQKSTVGKFIKIDSSLPEKSQISGCELKKLKVKDSKNVSLAIVNPKIDHMNSSLCNIIPVLKTEKVENFSDTAIISSEVINIKDSNIIHGGISDSIHIEMQPADAVLQSIELYTQVNASEISSEQGTINKF